MLTASEAKIIMRELCRLMEEYFQAPNDEKPLIYEDIRLLGTAIEPQLEEAWNWQKLHPNKKSQPNDQHSVGRRAIIVENEP